ncbi:MAG: DUF5815 family protein [Halosimplex sp.]
MAEPRVPGDAGTDIELPCGETVALRDLDMGLREYHCACGDAHAVVMDVHPLGRFVPEFLVDVLTESVETADEFPEFTTAHVMAMVMEDSPDAVVAEDLSEVGDVGYSMVWLTDFDARRLHEIVVELLVELMDHAVSHADDDEATAQFERWLDEFDVSEFVEQYRAEREFESEHDSAV